MKISIIGTGYVGLVSGACLAQMGNKVICVDIDKEKVDNLNRAIIPIYEPGLEVMVKENFKQGTLSFTTDIKDAIGKSDICYIAVGTPTGDDGSADLQYVLQVATDIGKYMIHHLTIVDKSTVPVGTTELVRETIRAELKKRGEDIDFDVVSNPEFLKEGTAIDDFMKPDRVVVGTSNPKILKKMKELYAPFTRNHEKFIAMDEKSSEMTKYVANAMLATKISLMNEVANICEKVGADVNKVRLGIGSDARIGYSFIYAGCGYGGSCFPKDIKALEKLSSDHGHEPVILKAIQEVNENQKGVIAKKVKARFGDDLTGLTFAVWGLSFKPGTDDTRDAPSLTVINDLTSAGARIKAYDPKAMEVAREHYLKGNESVEYVDTKYSALADADALILITEWKEFRSPDFDEIVQRLKNKIIFDGRNQYDSERLAELGIEYYQIGVKS